ncbi:MAG: amidophosphoribosyltransferase [Myxococcota bacterium]|jgi:amidophosphoribosyltransferase
MQFRDDNGLLAIVGHRSAAWLTALGLHAMHHRGRAGCGLAVSDGSGIRVLRGTGPTEDVFQGPAMDSLRGAVALGQVYGHPTSTVPDSVFVGGDYRPVVGRYRGGALAVGFSGRLTNGAQVRRDLLERGRLFHGATDAELIAQLIAESRKGTFVNRVVDALWQVKGAYSLIVATEDRVVAVRDPRGFRPLLLAKVDGAHAVCSDDAPIALLGGHVLRELAPGELTVVEPRGLTSVRPFPKREVSPCSREPVTLAGTSSLPFGIGAQDLREQLGERLGKERAPMDADIVVGLPESGVAVALGFARACGLPFRSALVAVQNHGHNPVRPPRSIPSLDARLKWSVVRPMVASRRVALVVSEMGTGRTVRDAVQLLRDAGASSVDVRCASPAATQACRYGVSSPIAEELTLPRFSTEEAVATWLGARTMAFLDADSLKAALNEGRDEPVNWCRACMTGEYPLPPEAPDDQLGLFDGGDAA